MPVRGGGATSGLRKPDPALTCLTANYHTENELPNSIVARASEVRCFSAKAGAEGKSVEKNSSGLTPPADVRYRPADSADIAEMADVYLAAVSDMFARNNVTATVPPRAAVLAGYGHILATGGFEVAERRGRIAALAGAVVRGPVWFLSGFWVLPALQRRGIGMPLLRRVWSAGRAAGAKIFFTWSSVDRTAMAAYMKLGMLPGFPNLIFEGTPRHLSRMPAAGRVEPLAGRTIAAMDESIRGVKRPQDHAFWSGPGNLAGKQVRCGKTVAGYFYTGPTGTVGPAAWREDADAAAVLTGACRRAAATAATVRLAIPGVNHRAIAFALAAGLRLTSFTHFLTTAPLGRMDRYIPSGPLLY
jgi:GNAT superfamily N-acetyltransferase